MQSAASAFSNTNDTHSYVSKIEHEGEKKLMHLGLRVAAPRSSTKSSVFLIPVVSATMVHPPISSDNSRTSRRIDPGMGVTIYAGWLTIHRE